MEHIDAWQSNSLLPIVLNDGSTFDFAIPGAVIGGHALDMANEGMFVDIPFVATSGADAGAVPLTIKCT